MKRLLLALLLVTSSVFASDCPDLYPAEKQISPANTTELCNSFFVTVYDLKLRGPLFSSESVFLEKSHAARINSFRPDKRLNHGQRAELSDYSNTAEFDRGHLTPAGDANTDKEMRDTFLLSNMVPQYSAFNRGDWQKLEKHVRRNLTRYIHVVTGAIYKPGPNGKVQTIGKNEIPVPAAMYKIVYWDRPVVFYSENSLTPRVREISFDELEKQTGIKFPRKDL